MGASQPLLLTVLLMVGAEDRPAVPVELQAGLLAKVLSYDRGHPARAGEEGLVLLVHLDSPDSVAVARQLQAALQRQPLLGGRAHHEELVRFTTAGALASLARERGAAVLVLAPGLAAHAADLGSALDGEAVLTVSTTPEGVREGVVLGFDLVAGRPRMLLNLAQARRQRVDFKAELLQLMRVFP